MLCRILLRHRGPTRRDGIVDRLVTACVVLLLTASCTSGGIQTSVETTPSVGQGVSVSGTGTGTVELKTSTSLLGLDPAETEAAETESTLHGKTEFGETGVETTELGETGVETAGVETAGVKTAEPVQAPRAPIVLGFAGDTSFTNGLDTRDPFGQVLDLLRAPDLMVLNLETAVADPGVGRPPVQKSFLFKSPPESLGLLVEAGVDVVALANNHSLDFGSEALAQTLEEIDKTSLLRVGAGIDEESAYHQLVVEVGGWSVGLVSLSRVPCDWSASGNNVRPEVAWACPAFLDLADALVERTMRNSDVTVVMVHGGTEGVLCPSGFMIELEKHWADLGVDLVIDGHPHVTQGITSIQREGRPDTLVVHSLGNFAFPSANGITANTAIFEVTVSETTAGEPMLSLHVQPLRAPGGVLSLPTAEQHDAIVEQLNRVSDGWRLDSDGNATKDSSHRTTC